MGDVTAIEQTQPASASRAFGYQDWQYYLDCIAGPWSSGAADCNPTSGARELLYDLAGNRTFDTSPAQSLLYEPNAATSGDTSELDEIAVPLSKFVRDYTFDAAGYVSQIEDLNDTTPISSVDFTFDAAGQLSLMDHSANDSAELSYDGRGFLRYGSVGAFTELAPTYSSDGLLYSLLRDWSPLTPHERHNVLYFAGRPIAIWKKVGTNTATLVRIVTDHLGTPAASIQQAGTAVDWYGGFMPFGEDWQAGTGQDSLSKGIFLRLPGQWKDSIWSTSSSPLEIFYNVHRWYEPQTGRYISVDPLGLHVDSRMELPTHAFAYVGSRPTRFKDTLGLFTLDGSCGCLSGQGSGRDKPSKDRFAFLVASVSRACGEQLSRITDVPLRRCVGGSCDSGVIDCRDDCPSGKLGGTTDTVLARILHVFGGAIRTAKLCTNNWQELLAADAGDVAIHEWAHGCGWLHGQLKGVPGPSGTF